MGKKTIRPFFQPMKSTVVYVSNDNGHVECILTMKAFYLHCFAVGLGEGNDGLSVCQV
jgi:hypothetical protein